MMDNKNEYKYIKPHFVEVRRFWAIPGNLIECLYSLSL